jgi:hypothetical protein
MEKIREKEIYDKGKKREGVVG